MNAAAYNALLDSFGEAYRTPQANPPVCEVAHGELGFEGVGALLPSELPGVSDEAWSEFVRRMASGTLGAVTPHNALGLFEMSPRRLADLGLLSKKHLRRRKAANGKTIWTSIFKPPLTAEKFLASPWLQYRAFADSMRDYAERMQKGEIARPASVSLSGALVVLHRAGPGGLASWESGKRLPATQRLYDLAQGVF